MPAVNIFLASSCELIDDRREFEIFINRKNKAWADKGRFLNLIVWEDFLDTLSQTRLQDEYNKAIRECDIFVMLFCTRVGQYTREEFETAFGQFKSSNKPVIFTYFKSTDIDIGSADEEELASLLDFKKRLRELGHFPTVYENTDGLNLHFGQQLDKLAAGGFIDLNPDNGVTAPGGGGNQASLSGTGAIAQQGSTAVASGGVSVGGNNTGAINTGTQTTITTGGGAIVGGDVNISGGDFIGRDKISHGISPAELETLFAPVLAIVTRQAPASMQTQVIKEVEELKTETAKGSQADDNKMARIIDRLVDMAPGAVGALVKMFASPILSSFAGSATRSVLDKIKSL